MTRKHDRLFNSLRNRLYGEVFPFVITGVYGGIIAWGKYRDSSRASYLSSLIPVFTTRSVNE